MNKDFTAINTIRFLAMDAIQKANSGHPGLPIGSAPMAYTLWSKEMKHDPKDPDWKDRDRFILSAGHGSMLIYSLLHLFGYPLTMEDIKNFRQWGSLTPGHPEYKHTKGVEVTSGPLGQGIAMSVGFAMAEAHLAAEFNKPGYDVVDHYTYCLTGDGCLEEGVSAEACSLAGHLGLGKLILLYDSNKITIEGNTDFAFTESVKTRFEAYGWQVLEVADGNCDLEGIQAAIKAAKAETGKPSIIIVKTTIGFGTPNQGTAKVHGSPIGEENIAITRKEMGWEYDPFVIPEEVKAEIAELQKGFSAAHKAWDDMFADYAAKYPEDAAKFEAFFKPVPADLFDDDMYKFDGPLATRQSSGEVLNRIAAKLPNLMGGSADLAPSNNTLLKAREYFSKEDRLGTNIHFGVREFSMAAITNGMVLHGGLVSYCATFMVFCDYLKPALRLAALMGIPTIFVLTHDSIGVGEDGPTHQPIEQLAMMRSLPNSYTFRPADSKETAAAYEIALNAEKPTCICLTRQKLPLYEETGKGALKGAYILKDSDDPEVILIGTGSEVEICMAAYDELKAKGVAARVVSMPCMELFEEQDEAYRKSVLPCCVKAVAVEAGTSFGWAKYADDCVCIDHFGASAPAGTLFKEFGFTAENVVAKALKVIGK